MLLFYKKPYANLVNIFFYLSISVFTLKMLEELLNSNTQISLICDILMLENAN